MKFDFSHDSMKTLEKLDSNLAGRIIKGIIGLPDKGQIKSLSGELEGLLRLRIGNWRITYSVENETVLIKQIKPRGEIYK
ncbi:MAG: type II toxin-antitoxin system RelE/ParE family toxin [Oscillospiraceae bacterium]|nr:type II toxin-antitoxin system RelE/ParE family toxin [Oscillospiraceae bacterium]